MEELKIAMDFLARIFTVQQQTAIFIMSLCVLVSTHNFKIIWFGFHKECDPDRKIAIIRLFAVIAGSLFGAIGYAITDIKEPLWFWLVCGMLSSGGSIAIVDLYKKWAKK